MPQTPHVEKHFTGSAVVRDIVIGMSDGLTVPFALAAGLAGTVKAASVIVIAGLAEVAAGSIAMGLGGYLAARSDAEHFDSERAREVRETQEMPEEEAEEVAEVFRGFGMKEDAVQQVVTVLRADRERRVDFMMQFELGLEKPEPRCARRSALTIALSYIAGGLVPLLPYFFIPTPHSAPWCRWLLPAWPCWFSATSRGGSRRHAPGAGARQTLLVGGLAAAAAFLIAWWIGGEHSAPPGGSASVLGAKVP